MFIQYNGFPNKAKLLGTTAHAHIKGVYIKNRIKDQKGIVEDIFFNQMKSDTDEVAVKERFSLELKISKLIRLELPRDTFDWIRNSPHHQRGRLHCHWHCGKYHFHIRWEEDSL